MELLKNKELTLAVLAVLLLLVGGYLFGWLKLEQLGGDTPSTEPTPVPRFTLYYAPYCGACKAVLPKVLATQQKLGKDIIKVVDCEAQPDVAEQKGIEYFPTAYVQGNNEPFVGADNVSRALAQLS